MSMNAEVDATAAGLKAELGEKHGEKQSSGIAVAGALCAHRSSPRFAQNGEIDHAYICS
jgi:hypothetical protein